MDFLGRRNPKQKSSGRDLKQWVSSSRYLGPLKNLKLKNISTDRIFVVIRSSMTLRSINVSPVTLPLSTYKKTTSLEGYVALAESWDYVVNS